MGQGMPDCNKIWTEKDFQKAQNTIGSLIIKDFYLLPRKNSRKSGEVFKRIISKDNFDFLEDPAISLREKAYRIQALGNMMGQMGSLYTNRSGTRQYYSEELIELYVTHLFVRGKMLELAEKINKSSREEDVLMQAGRNGIIGSYVFLITFLVSEQEKTGAFASMDLRKLSRELSNSIKDNKGYLDLESKQKISSLIKKSMEKSPPYFIEKNYKNILTLLAE